MVEVDTQCVQRWFGELTGYPTCTGCNGLIVDYQSSSNSSNASNPSQSRLGLHPPLSSSPPFSPPFSPHSSERHQLRHVFNANSGEQLEYEALDSNVSNIHEHFNHPTSSPDSPNTKSNEQFETTSFSETTTTATTRTCHQDDDAFTPVTKRFSFQIKPSFTSPAPDHEEEAVLPPECCCYNCSRYNAMSSKSINHSCNKTPMMSRLKDFYPGFIRKAPGPCNACKRVEGPHPTHCPGCTADYIKRVKENPPRPPGYVGKRPPFGLAGWRVARGHRHPKPVTLHSYGCFMQRKLNCYGGKYINNFVHLGEPPTLLFNSRGCPQV